MSASAIRRCLLVTALCLNAGSALPAQSLLASRIRADNDAFDFWMPPWTRPDEEYTSGVQGSLTYAGRAWWNRLAGPFTGHCAPADTRGATHTWSLGQKIYSGALRFGDVAPPPGSRPAAGWLYVTETERVETPGRAAETSLTVGVTGPPALASFFQRVAHGYAPTYNRPVDWSRQLPFEPGFVLRHERWRRAWGRDDAKGWSVAVDPHAGASLGTVLTELVAGMRASAGYPARRSAARSAPSPRMEYSLFADAVLHGVVRNEFLDGTFFRTSEHVNSRSLVSDLQAGATARWRQVGLTYEVHRVGPEYRTRTASHAWASIGVEWRFK